MIALCLGGARSVWSDLAQARSLIGERPHLVVACNEAAGRYPGRLDGMVTLHPEFIPHWLRGRTDAPRLFSHEPHVDSPGLEVVPERYGGSSGLYAAQVAIEAMGAKAAILCGAPMDPDAGHIARPGPWSGSIEAWRRAFIKAGAEIEVRSMSGWSAERLGQPDPAWIERAYGASDAGPGENGPDRRRRRRARASRRAG